jgi:hypothetical protein
MFLKYLAKMDLILMLSKFSGHMGPEPKRLCSIQQFDRSNRVMESALRIPNYCQYKNERKCRIGSNLHPANITLNISTNYVQQPAIEANCKRPAVYSLILRFTASRNIIYCLLQNSRSHI